MPQTAQSHVQMEPSEILPEGETFPIVTFALPVASVHCPIAVSGAMNVKMALSVHRVELLLLCAWQDISVTRPRLSYPALQDIIVLRHHPRPFLVQRDTIATHCITAITIPYIETRVLVTPRFALLVCILNLHLPLSFGNASTCTFIFFYPCFLQSRHLHLKFLFTVFKAVHTVLVFENGTNFSVDINFFSLYFVVKQKRDNL